MQRTDVLMLLRYTGELWPNYKLPADAPSVDLRVQAWLDVLGDLEPAAVRAALVACSAEDFAPPPGRLRELVIEHVIGEVPDVVQAWAEFLNACRHGIYDEPVWTNEVIAEAARCFDVRALAVSDEADLENVTQAHFRRVYEIVAARWRREHSADAPAIAALAREELTS